MLWKGLQLFSPVTKRHVEQQLLRNTHIQHLFQIIQDVDQYSRFLPLCSYSRIIEPSTKKLLDGRQYFEATLTVGVPPLLQETYLSAVYIDPQLYTVETMSLNSQKFDSLKSFWKLSMIPPSTMERDNHPPHGMNRPTIPGVQPCTGVHFTVEMTVSDPLIASTLDQVLEKVAKQQVQAFAERCQQIPYIPSLQ